jgi:hypothetical protein
LVEILTVEVPSVFKSMQTALTGRNDISAVVIVSTHPSQCNPSKENVCSAMSGILLDAKVAQPQAV